MCINKQNENYKNRIKYINNKILNIYMILSFVHLCMHIKSFIYIYYFSYLVIYIFIHPFLYIY